MEQRKIIYRHLGALFALALALRVGYVLLAINNIGLESFVAVTFDSKTYLAASRELFGSPPNGPSPLFLVGPGYAFILGVLRIMFGEGYVPGICFSIVMGALAPVAVYLFAQAIFNHTRLAFIAGVICAISHTSLSMSGRIMTDQPFFTLHCLTLVCYLQGLRSGRWKWFIGAGLMCGIAALVRPAGQFWPYIFFFLPMIIPVPGVFASRIRLLGRAAIVGLVALTITLSWSARNYFVNDVFTFGYVGVQTVRNCVVAQVESDLTRKSISDLRVIYDSEDGDHALPLAVSYGNMQRRVRAALASHPWEFLDYYRKNVTNNALESNRYLTRDFPVLAELGFMRFWEALKGINAAIMIVSILGLGLLAFEKRWSGLVILGVVFVYFTLVTGFSIWQGSRLHYPAEMSWSVLIAYVWVRSSSLWQKPESQLEGHRF